MTVCWRYGVHCWSIMQWSRPLLCLQCHDSKCGSGLFFYWSLFRNNNMAINLQRFTSSYGEDCQFSWFAAKSSRFYSLSAVKFSISQFIGVGAGKFLGVRRIQTFPKSFCAPFAHNFLPQWTWRSVFGVTSKIGLNCVFLQMLGAKQRWAPFLPGFQGFSPGFSGILPRFSEVLPKSSGILPKFLTNQNLWGCVCTSRLLHHCSS